MQSPPAPEMNPVGQSTQLLAGAIEYLPAAHASQPLQELQSWSHDSSKSQLSQKTQKSQLSSSHPLQFVP